MIIPTFPLCDVCFSKQALLTLLEGVLCFMPEHVLDAELVGSMGGQDLVEAFVRTCCRAVDRGSRLLAGRCLARIADAYITAKPATDALYMPPVDNEPVIAKVCAASPCNLVVLSRGNGIAYDFHSDRWHCVRPALHGCHRFGGTRIAPVHWTRAELWTASYPLLRLRCLYATLDAGGNLLFRALWSCASAPARCLETSWWLH